MPSNRAPSSRLSRCIDPADGLTPQAALAAAQQRLDAHRDQAKAALAQAIAALQSIGAARTDPGHDPRGPDALADEIASLAGHLGLAALAQAARGLADLDPASAPKGRGHAEALDLHRRAIVALHRLPEQDGAEAAPLLAGLKAVRERQGAGSRPAAG